VTRAGGSLIGRLLVTVVMVGFASAVHLVAERVGRIARSTTSTMLRRTRLITLVSFYRHFAFDLPKLTSAAGVSLLLGIAAVRIYWLAHGNPPAYLAAYFALVATFATFSAIAILAVRWWTIVRVGWAVGSLVSLSAACMYIVSRGAGLPEVEQYTYRWEYALGTFGLVLCVAYLGLHFAVVTKMTVAYPQRQQWYD
jgi:hypothetical protein